MSARSTMWKFVPATVLVLIIVVQTLRQAWPDLVFFVVALIAAVSQSSGSRPRWVLPELSPVVVGIAALVGAAIIASPPRSAVVVVMTVDQLRR